MKSRGRKGGGIGTGIEDMGRMGTGDSEKSTGEYYNMEAEDKYNDI